MTKTHSFENWKFEVLSLLIYFEGFLILCLTLHFLSLLFPYFCFSLDLVHLSPISFASFVHSRLWFLLSLPVFCLSSAFVVDFLKCTWIELNLLDLTVCCLLNCLCWTVYMFFLTILLSLVLVFGIESFELCQRQLHPVICMSLTLRALSELHQCLQNKTLGMVSPFS